MRLSQLFNFTYCNLCSTGRLSISSMCNLCVPQSGNLNYSISLMYPIVPHREIAMRWLFQLTGHKTPATKYWETISIIQSHWYKCVPLADFNLNYSVSRIFCTLCDLQGENLNHSVSLLVNTSCTQLAISIIQSHGYVFYVLYRETMCYTGRLSQSFREIVSIVQSH